MKPPPTEQVTLRLSVADLETAEKEAGRLSLLHFTRTDVLRVAVSLGLEAVKKMQVPRAKPKRG